MGGPPARAPGMSASERRRFMSGKVSQIRTKPDTESANRKGRGKYGSGGDPEEDAEFKATLKQVLDYVLPNMGKKERRHYEENRVRALGGTLEKRNKMPYSLLQQEARRHEEKRQRILEEEKTLGISTSVSAHRQDRQVDKLF